MSTSTNTAPPQSAEYIASVAKVLTTPVIFSCKRPHVRSRHAAPPMSIKNHVHKVVFDIINPVRIVDTKPKAIIYQERTEQYFRLLEKNNEYYNIPFITPVVSELTFVPKAIIVPEKHIEYLDQVQVGLSVLKNGKVRIKLVLHQAQLYEKYYSHAKPPPIKTIINTYTNLGYTDAFIQSFTEKHEKRKVFREKMDKVLERIFAKPVRAKKKSAAPKTKKVVVVEAGGEGEEEIIEEEEEVEEEEEDGPEEDEAIVADDEDDEEEDAGEDGDLADFE